MKINLLIIIVILMISHNGQSQVGIGTSIPQGALDINSSNKGIVYPVVSLTGLNSQTITNPNNINLVAGTTVFNTNTTNIGINSVYPGLYIWNGSQWVPQFSKKDNVFFYQNANLRTASNGGNQTVSFNSNSFVPKFNGKYKLTVNVQYGGGSVDSPTTPQFTNFVAEHGIFKFQSLDGNTVSFALQSFSGKNNDQLFKGGSTSPIRTYTNTVNQKTYILEHILTAGTLYSFNLDFNQDPAPGFEGNGNNTAGNGYIEMFDATKCTVEINYVSE